MAKQSGHIRLKGKLGDLSFYTLNGQDIVRKATGPSKERIDTDPAFINVKRNTQEFGGASVLSKGIRQGLGANAQQFKDTFMASRLTGVCHKIIQKGSGNIGEREANVLNTPELLLGFNLNKDFIFNHIYTSKIESYSNFNRTVITVDIPKSAPKDLQHKPEHATHFCLMAVLGTLSKYTRQGNSYQPTVPDQNGLGFKVSTEPLLCKIEHNNIQLQLNLSEYSPEVVLSLWMGITYLEKHNNLYYQLDQPKAMACIGVF